MALKIEEVTMSYVTKLKVRARDNKPRVLVVFHQKVTKDAIYKARIRLKGKDVWISEDLTIKMSQLAYMSREAARKGHAHSSWTMNGKVFVEKTEGSAPHMVSTADKMMEYLDITPLLDEDEDDEVDSE